MGKSPRPWKWKVAETQDVSALRLLYEPGNWGDILKSSWALAILRQLLVDRKEQTFYYLDPFSGLPEYPLTKGTVERLNQLNARDPLLGAIETYLSKGKFPSTGMLVRELCLQNKVKIVHEVCDCEASHREIWRGIDQIKISKFQDAAETLSAALGNESKQDFVLLDPYDILNEWGRWLPLILKVAKTTPILVYLYNRSPQGAGQLKQYELFRKNLEEKCSEKIECVIGRVPADAKLPRAYHELLYLGPKDLVDEVLIQKLEQITQALYQTIASKGHFEKLNS